MLWSNGMSCSKAFNPSEAAVGQGEYRRSIKLEGSLQQLVSNAMRSKEWRLKWRSNEFQAFSDNLQSRSEHAQEGGQPYCREKEHMEINSQVQLTTTVQDLLDGLDNRRIPAAKVVQGSLESSIISMNINPRVTYMVWESQEQAYQSLRLERVMPSEASLDSILFPSLKRTPPYEC